jgi:hypothetical protein
MAGNRSTTHAAYESAWHNWSDWCAGRSHDPLSNDLASILDFLAALNTSGKSYNTVNIHRSMLSVTLEPIVSTPVGQHPLVIRLLKGCYNQNPPLPRYSTLWDVETVFQFMRNSEDNLSLSFSALSRKLSTLQAISTLLRVSELASVDRLSITFTQTGAQFTLSKPRKSQFCAPLRLVSFIKVPERKICPVDCLRAYLFISDYYRSEENNHHLFISLSH